MPLIFDDFVTFFSAPDRHVGKIQREVGKHLQSARAAALAAIFAADPDPTQSLRQWHIACRGANLWTTALPTSREFRLSNLEYHAAVQFNLGLRPFSYPAVGGPVPCAHTNPRCAQVDLRSDLEHPLCCNNERKKGRNLQHNNVQHFVESLARACNARVEHPTELALNLPNPNQRPDIQLSFFDESILVDVAGVHVTAQSYVAVSQHDPFAAMTSSFQTKITKYAEISRAHGLQLHPFVFSTFCSHPASDNGSASRASTAHFYKTALSVSIMRDNARMISSSHRRTAERHA